MREQKYKGVERRRSARIGMHFAKSCVLLITFGAAFALMFFYMG